MISALGVQPIAIPFLPKLPQWVMDWLVKLVVDQLNKLIADGTLEIAVKRLLDWAKVHLVSLGREAMKVVLDKALAAVRATPNKLDDRVVELLYKELGLPLPA